MVDYITCNLLSEKKAIRFSGWLCITNVFKLYQINTAIYKLGKFGTG